MDYSETLIKKTATKIWHKWSIAFRIMPIVIVVTVLKFFSHEFGFEVMELNALFTSLVAGTIFLIGFLISGVLSDYKESEKIPSDLHATIKALFDDTCTVYEGKNSETARQFIEYQKVFSGNLKDWFYKKERTQSLLTKVSAMNSFFVQFDKDSVQANYIIKMKNEQNNIRKAILRIDTIRDTGFIGPAYAIVEAMAFAIVVGLVIIDIKPFYASLFITTIVTFLISYMIFLIKDLDNPFDYSVNGEDGTEVSLKPIYDVNYVLNEYKT